MFTPLKLDVSKEIQPIHPKGNQSWIFIGRTDAEAETPILWPPDVKNWLIWKDPDAGNDWGRRRRGRQRMGCLDAISDSMDLSLSKVQEVVMDRGAWRTSVHGSQRVRHNWVTELNRSSIRTEILSLFFNIWLIGGVPKTCYWLTSIQTSFLTSYLHTWHFQLIIVGLSNYYISQSDLWIHHSPPKNHFISLVFSENDTSAYSVLKLDTSKIVKFLHAILPLHPINHHQDSASKISFIVSSSISAATILSTL